jgi:hypothetical protein
MSRGFRAVRDVYLGHTLAATLELFGRLAARNDESAEMQFCVSACETVLRYVRSAQYACGVLGLVAIDRSQEHLRMCLKNLSATTASHTPGRTICAVAGLCYASALNRRCKGDIQLEKLWMFAANCSDAVFKLRSNQACPIRTAQNYVDPPVALELRKALIAKAAKFDMARNLAFQAERRWNSRVSARSANLCRSAVVCAATCDIYQSESRILPAIDKTLYHFLKYQIFAAQAAISVVERNALVWVIADSPHTVAIKALAEVAAQRLLATVELIASEPDALPPQAYGYNSSLLQERQRRTAPLERNATALANLAAALTAVTMQIADMRAAAAVPEQLLTSAAKQVHHLTAEVEATAGSDGDDAAHVRDFVRLKAEIEQIGEKLRTAEGSAASPEERAIQRFLMEAGKVRREASPAHPHMAECWLQAASHMRLSVDARAAATTAVDAQRVDKHRACCRIYEKLAAGTFRDAASYFTNAARTPLPYARELWREAADLALQLGVGYMQRVDEVAMAETFFIGLLTTPTPLHSAQASGAAACAACAEAVEDMPEAEAAALVSTWCGGGSSGRTGTTVAAANEQDSEGLSYAQITLRMLLLSIGVERSVLTQTATNPFAAAAHTVLGGTLNLLRAVVNGVLLLSRTCQMTVPVYPVDNIPHRTAPSVETVQQRDQLLRWLSDAAVEVYKHLHKVLNAKLRSGCRDKAIESFRLSLNVVEGILWYVFPAESAQPANPAQTYQQAVLHQVLCKRYLAASDMALADKPLARALLVKSAQQHILLSEVTPISAAISNGLVRRAWDEPPAAIQPLPAELLLPSSADGLSAAAAARLPQLVEAHYLSIVHQLALGETPYMPSNEAALRRKAIEISDYIAAGIVEHLTDTTPRPAAQAQRLDVQCARASRAATWCSLAVDAFRNARTDVSALYERATWFVILGASLHTKARQRKVEAQAQQAGDKAGTRFAEAGNALAANDAPLYQLWLQAAEATALLVEVTHGRRRNYGQKKLLCSTQYSDAAVEAADQLEVQALALQSARQQALAAPPSGESVAVASEGRQRKRQRRDA